MLLFNYHNIYASNHSPQWQNGEKEAVDFPRMNCLYVNIDRHSAFLVWMKTAVRCMLPFDVSPQALCKLPHHWPVVSVPQRWCTHKAVEVKLSRWLCIRASQTDGGQYTVYFGPKICLCWQAVKLRRRWGEKASLISALLCGTACRQKSSDPSTLSSSSPPVPFLSILRFLLPFCRCFRFALLWSSRQCKILSSIFLSVVVDSYSM